MRTKDAANYALNRKPENRRIYAEQQVAWFYADLLKAQHGYNLCKSTVLPYEQQKYWHDCLRKAMRDLAEAHAGLDALTEGDAR